jgi:hypothetical protein
VTVQTAPAARAAVAGAIRGSRATTPYARAGDAFGWACLAVVAIALVPRPRATRDGGA